MGGGFDPEVASRRGVWGGEEEGEEFGVEQKA